MLSWLTFGLPWAVWGVLGAAGAGGVAVVVGYLLGHRAALWTALIALAGVAVVVINHRSRQQGYSERKAEESSDALRAIEAIRRIRDRARAEFRDPDGLRNDDGFKRD